MHISEVEAEALSSQPHMNPVNGSLHDHLAKSQRATPGPVFAPVMSCLLSSDSNISQATPVGPIQIFPTSDARVIESYSDGLCQAQPSSEPDLVSTSHHTNTDGRTANHQLQIPVTPKRRRDSVVRSPTSSDSDRSAYCQPSKSTLASQYSETEALDYDTATHPIQRPWTSPTNQSTGPSIDQYSSPSVVADLAASECQVPYELEDDTLSSLNASFGADSPSSANKNAVKRAYTNSLGPPCEFRRGSSTELDTISDLGDQQQLRQRKNDPNTTRLNDAKIDLAESVAALPENSCHELQGSLLEALQMSSRSQSCDQEFLPRGELRHLINPESVFRELTKDLSAIHSPKNIRGFAETVCSEIEVIRDNKIKIKSFRKIFALLVLVEKTSSIPLFIEEDVSDLDLPLLHIKNDQINGLCRKGTTSAELRLISRCFKPPQWSPVKLRNFQEWQWTMLAPFFSRDDDGDIKHYTLPDQCILPFIHRHDGAKEDDDKTGGFGRVLMVRLHKDHHNFHKGKVSDQKFAVKQQLYEHDRDAFKKEISILKSFSGELGHRHIVSLLATYEQFKLFHLIFYRAEGDLFAFWNDINIQPHFNSRNVTWMVEQCAGIAEALLRLHRHLTDTVGCSAEYEVQSGVTGPKRETVTQSNRRVSFVKGHETRSQSSDWLEQPTSPITLGQNFLKGTKPLPSHQPHLNEHVHRKKYGRHGDINPGNILYYNDTGDRLQDFSGTLKLADFGQAELNTLLSKTKPRSVANTMTYRPPECDLSPKIIRQSYDIWCLGCVYLEFITWLFGGQKLLQKFTKLRSTPDVFQNNLHTDTFFQVIRSPQSGQPEVMIKKEVTHFIDELHMHPNCTDLFHDFLDTIQNNMLVVDSIDRISCEALSRHLKVKHLACGLGETYATKSNPWSIRRKPMPYSVKLRMSPDARVVIDQNLPVHLAPAAQQMKGRIYKSNADY